jgi:transcriptional regulator with XRE-family HTH domain
MTPLTRPKKPPKPQLHGNRLHAVLALHRLTMRAFAERCSVTHSAISRICSGQRDPSSVLLRVMRIELGDHGFAYVTGATDVPPQEPIGSPA